MKSFRAIDRVVQTSGVSYTYIRASLSARHLPNAKKKEIKKAHQDFFRQVVGRPTNEHTADAFCLGWEYLRPAGAQGLVQGSVP